MIKRVVGLSRQVVERWAQRQPVEVDPRVRLVTLRSTALGVRKHFYVYTPPTHRSSRGRLPALYLFRGHEQEWINPAQDASRQGRTVIDVYEELLQTGTIGPMILVFPGISSDDNHIPGLLVNFKQPALTDAKGIGTGRFEDYFLDELVPYVDRRLGANPVARGVDGFSLGGFMAVKIAAQHPELFASVGAYDGLYFWDDPADPYSIALTDGTFRNPMFDPALGPGQERDLRYAAANNPSNLVRNGDAARLRRLTWLIEYGPKAGEPHDSNYYRGAHLCKLLSAKGVVNHGRGEIRTCGHSWRCADEHMRYVLPLHWQALQAKQQ